MVTQHPRSTVKHALQNTQNDCYQRLSDSSRVHQIHFRPNPAGGAYSAHPDPLAGFKCPTSKEGEEREREGKGREGEGK